LVRTGVEPTNNASERAPGHVVVSRKISGQIKGGKKWMDGRSQFIACRPTWHKHGLSIAG